MHFRGENGASMLANKGCKGIKAKQRTHLVSVDWPSGVSPTAFNQKGRTAIILEKIFCVFCSSVNYVQWLPEQMECRNAQIGKPAVPLWMPMTQKWFISHLKALNVGFNLRYQTLQKW